MLELETYVLEDETFDGWVGKAIHAVRLVCVLIILHTVYAFAVTVVQYTPTVPVDNTTTVWIAGFAAIEMNISEWREEIEEELEQEESK